MEQNRSSIFAKTDDELIRIIEEEFITYFESNEDFNSKNKKLTIAKYSTNKKKKEVWKRLYINKEDFCHCISRFQYRSAHSRIHTHRKRAYYINKGKAQHSYSTFFTVDILTNIIYLCYTQITGNL